MPFNALALNQQQCEALDRLIQYSWVDELNDYQECETENPENLRSGHIFEDLVLLDNVLNGIDKTPEDHLKEASADED
jgi:hypothetical protein